MTQVSTLGKLAVVTAGILGIATACGSTSSTTPPPGSSSGAKIGGSVTVWAEWTAQEQQDFLAALAPFEANTGITVSYQGKGNNMDTALTAAVSGGSPPDVALVPDPGTLQTLAKAGSIKDLTSILTGLTSNFGAAWNTLATYSGKQYGVWFKGANKNTIWYNPALFTAAGIMSPPTTWEQLLTDAAQLQAAGTTPFSLCTDVGWPVADMWQNIYLKTAGAADYGKLASSHPQVDRPIGDHGLLDDGRARRQDVVPAGWTPGLTLQRVPHVRGQGVPQATGAAQGGNGV